MRTFKFSLTAVIDLPYFCDTILGWVSRSRHIFARTPSPGLDLPAGFFLFVRGGPYELARDEEGSRGPCRVVRLGRHRAIGLWRDPHFHWRDGDHGNIQPIWRQRRASLQ